MYTGVFLDRTISSSILIKYAPIFAAFDACSTQMPIRISLNGCNMCNVLLISIRNTYNSEKALEAEDQENSEEVGLFYFLK